MDADGMVTQWVNNYCIHLASLVYSNHTTIRHGLNVIWEMRLMILLIIVLKCILNVPMPNGMTKCLHHLCWIDMIYTMNIISPLLLESIFALSWCTLYLNTAPNYITSINITMLSNTFPTNEILGHITLQLQTLQFYGRHFWQLHPDMIKPKECDLNNEFWAYV